MFLIYFQRIASLDISKAVPSNIKLTPTVDCHFFIRLLHNLYFDTIRTLSTLTRNTSAVKCLLLHTCVFSCSKMGCFCLPMTLGQHNQVQHQFQTTNSQACASKWPPLSTRIPVLQTTNYPILQLPDCPISDRHCHLH